MEKSEAVQVQLEHVGGSFWVLKNGSGIRMGDGKQGKGGDVLGEEKKSKRGGGGKAAISVIRKPALARY